MEVAKRKTALIVGITGQDGSYLAELLLEKRYVVHGIIRRSSSINTGRIEHLYNESSNTYASNNMHLHYGDLTDSSNLIDIVTKVKPNEVYNLGAQSHVKVSFELPEYTSNVDAIGTLRLLNAIRIANIADSCKFYQASTSELFGKVQETPQKETTPFYPRSPYAVAKQYAYWIVVNYREAYGMHLSNGILFNHESPRRGLAFVTRKITRAVANIKCGNQKTLTLGNLDAKRDWGHAKEYVYAMWLMLQQELPGDYVCATGETNTVRYFVEMSFAVVGIDIAWSGEGVNEIGVNKSTEEVLVKVSPKYYRPTEVELLIGDPTKAFEKLKWKTKINVAELCKEMVLADLALVQQRV
eukprot:g274.t1